MKTAIICYSNTQNNFILAGEILARTGGTFMPIEEKEDRTRVTTFLDILFNRTPAIKEYLHLDYRFDHYILISPVWGGKIGSPLKAFVKKEASKIKSYSFISVCGGGKDQRADIEKELLGLIGHKAVAVYQLSLTDLCRDKNVDLMNYRIDKHDLRYFKDQIVDFINTVESTVSPVVIV
jgi:hypothetical protein